MWSCVLIYISGSDSRLQGHRVIALLLTSRFSCIRITYMLRGIASHLDIWLTLIPKQAFVTARLKIVSISKVQIEARARISGAGPLQIDLCEQLDRVVAISNSGLVWWPHSGCNCNYMKTKRL